MQSFHDNFSSLQKILTLIEAKKTKMTPYQKAQQRRRQTIATHTKNPAKQSVFYKHAVRAIFQALRKKGDSFGSAAKGAQNVARWMLTTTGETKRKPENKGQREPYGTGDESGGFRLNSKGLRRNRMHASEPKSIRKRKEAAYDYIMGIQRRREAKKEIVRQKAASAG